MSTGNYKDQALTQFFMRKPARFKLDEIEESKLPDEEMLLAFAVFKSTLNEIVGAVQAFYNMAMAGAIDARFNRILMANRLRAMAKFTGTDKEKDDEEINREALKQTHAEWSLDGLDEELLQQVAHNLMHLSDNVPDLIAESNNAILRQSSVMLWGATENLLREYFRVSVNRKPVLSKHLFESEEAKRFWNVRDLTIDVIQGAGFDLGKCMGDVLIEINPMINLKSIKAAYAVICGNSENLKRLLKDKATYDLFALRNLVAHRNGLVDAKFLSETSFTIELNEKVIINPALFEKLYMAAKDIGVELFQYTKLKFSGADPQKVRP